VSETRDIPAHVRNTVDARDGLRCRVCGKYLGPHRRALHHVFYGGDYQGIGGRRRHDVDNIITVCWLPGDNDCHQRLHSDKRTYQQAAARVAVEPAITVLQVLRWERAHERPPINNDSTANREDTTMTHPTDRHAPRATEPA
jgi:hypothetical protein